MRQYLTIALALFLVVGGFWVAKYLVANKDNRKPEEKLTKQTVFVKPVQNKNVSILVTESGSLVAKHRMEIYSEVQGIMESTGKEFKPGVKYQKGETLLRIRSNDYYANLQAQKSNLQNLITSILPDLRLDFPDAYPRWDNYIRNFDISKPIPPLPEPATDKERFFVTGKNIFSTYYNTKNMEIILSKYHIKAPFKGVLADALVTPGTLVRQGQKLGEYIDPSLFELEVSVSKSILPYLAVGKSVNVKDLESAKHWAGKIIRINDRVDTNTQTVRVFIELRGEGLKEGLFLEAEMAGKEEKNALEISRSLLIDETNLFVVKDSTLSLVPVEVAYFTQATAIVKGLENDQMVVVKPVPGGYSGMQVNFSILKD